MKNRKAKTPEKLSLPPVVMFLAVPGIPGAIHRMLNGRAYANIKELIESLDSNGRILKVERGDIRDSFASVFKGMSALKQFWHEF
jgi:hypothetical protein